MDPSLAASKINDFNPDFVHLHLDHLYVMEPMIKCKHIAITNHDGYAEWIELRPKDYHEHVIDGTKKFGGYHICPSERLRQFYINTFKIPENVVFSVINGANPDSIRFDESVVYTDKTLCLGQIHEDSRKNQHFLSTCNANIDFAGGLNRFAVFTSPNYLGSWTKQDVYEKLTQYPNLILLSKGEAAPLVVVEAMMAGLGVVVSERAAANLDTTLPWVDVIPSKYVYDADYVKNVVETNRLNSIKWRHDIRNYSVNRYSWKSIIDGYNLLVKHKILKW
jgi:glycosyltransferase involved in cell wall biosynthesis